MKNNLEGEGTKLNLYFDEHRQPIPLFLYPIVSVNDMLQFIQEYLADALSEHKIDPSNYDAVDMKSREKLTEKSIASTRNILILFKNNLKNPIDLDPLLLTPKSGKFNFEKRKTEEIDEQGQTGRIFIHEQSSHAVGNQEDSNKYFGMHEKFHDEPPPTLKAPTNIEKNSHKQDPEPASHAKEHQLIPTIHEPKYDHYLFLTGSIENDPIDGTDKNILSLSKSVGSFSFIPPGDTLPKDYPPPIYCKSSEVIKLRGILTTDVLAGVEKTQTGELKCVDKAVLDSQKGIIGEVIKKITESIAQGRGIVGVSLPVRIFEPRSMIERINDFWAYTPAYITPAAQLTDPVERFLHVIRFAVAGLHMSVSQRKPFNPLLGETFQGSFPDGSEIYCEHTSHHPPVDNFLIMGKGYRFYGRYEYIAKGNTTYNIISLTQDGLNHVEFADKQKVSFTWPTAKICGLLMGDRLTKWGGVMRFVDKANRLKALIKMNAGKKGGLFSKSRSDLIEGKVYFVKPGQAQDIKIGKEAKKKDTKDEFKYADLEKNIADISGSWLDKVYLDSQILWDIETHRPMRHTCHSNPLPSDWRFREDLLWVRYGDLKKAEKWKLKLEERQRFERKLRLDKKKK